jgi:tetratricopeptide (TPR) repeat protein
MLLQRPILFFIINILVFSNVYSQTKHNTRNAKRVSKTEHQIKKTEENDEHVHLLGLYIQNSIVENNVDDFMSKMDVNSFMDLVMANENDVDSAFSNGFRKGIEKGLKALPQRIIQQVDTGSYYDFISYRYANDEQTYYMLFRLFSTEDGLNYHNYKVNKKNGELMFSDIYIYLTGESLTKTMGKMYIYALPEKNKLNIFGEKKSEEFNKVIEAASLLKEGKPKEGYNILRSLKSDLAKDKFVLLIKSQMANYVGEELYEKSLKEIINTYPEDQTLYLNFIDYYIMLENYDEALKLVEKLQDETQDDFLNFMKGNLQYANGEVDSTQESFNYIITNYSDFFSGYVGYMTCLISKEEYKETIDVLNNLTKQGYEKQVLVEFVEEKDENGYNEFANLVTSQEYNNWKAQ